MTREDARAKGLRYLTEARLTIQHVDETQIHATCRGTEEVHRLTYDPHGWHCSCPANGRCSHLWALQTVTTVRPTRKDQR